MFVKTNCSTIRLLSLCSLTVTPLLLDSTHPVVAKDDDKPGITRRKVSAEETLGGKLTVSAKPDSIVAIGWTKVDGTLAGKDSNGVKGPFKVGKDGKLNVAVPWMIDGDAIDDVIIDIKEPDPPGTVKEPPPPYPKPGDPGWMDWFELKAWSSLHIEALGRDGNDLTVTRFVTAVWEINGMNNPLWVPQVYGDLNGDGIVGEGDCLYSVVDLFAYAAGGLPTFSVGDTFSIVGGASSAFPGMFFGSAPITLDASEPSGFLNPSPVTLTGTIWGSTGVTVTSISPEPGTLALLGLGSVPLGVMAIRRRRTKASGSE